MSHDFYLICPDKGIAIHIGQSRGEKLTNFYSGEPDAMRALGNFLAEAGEESVKIVRDDEMPGHGRLRYYEWEARAGDGMFSPRSLRVLDRPKVVVDVEFKRIEDPKT